MILKQVIDIMEKAMQNKMLDPEMAFLAGCEEIARRCAIIYTDDDDIIMILIDHVPAFAEYVELNKVNWQEY